MKKTFEIRFYQHDDEDTLDAAPYPTDSEFTADLTFNDGVTWDVVLWQFCKFLEMTGYEGVRAKIRIEDPLGFMSQNHLFECIVSPDMVEEMWGDIDDAEEDEEEASDEEKVTVSYKDMKNEVA